MNGRNGQFTGARLELPLCNSYFNMVMLITNTNQQDSQFEEPTGRQGPASPVAASQNISSPHLCTTHCWQRHLLFITVQQPRLRMCPGGHIFKSAKCRFICLNLGEAARGHFFFCLTAFSSSSLFKYYDNF